MADYIKADARKMAKDIDRLQSSISGIPGQISLLEESLTLLSRMWDGDAWLAFQTQMKGDIEQLRDLYEFCRKYLEAFSEAKYFYQDAEIKVDDEVKSLSLLSIMF